MLDRADDLNVLYSAALEFGENWRRPISELARERLADRTRLEREELVQEVTEARSAIEDRIRARYEFVAGAWESDEAEAATLWITENYSWMTSANLNHAISQGVYYAWHG